LVCSEVRDDQMVTLFWVSLCTQCNEEVQCFNIEIIFINTPVWYAPTNLDKDGEESPHTLVCSEVRDDQMDRGQAFSQRELWFCCCQD